MSVSLALLAIAAQQIVIPLGRPKPVERLPASLAVSGKAFARTCTDNDEWDKPAPPVRLHGNTYYVGTCGISALLITDKQGHIVIDGGTEKGGDLIAANIRRLGFKLSDVKYLLHSHEHHDHVGGLARLQQLTGAQVVASEVAAPSIRSGRADPADPQAAILDPFPGVAVARTVKDGDKVRVGGSQLTALATSGHTAGALSWQWVSCEGGVCRTFVYADSMSPVSSKTYRFSDHPEIVATFRSSIEKTRKLECDILVTPHPVASNLRQRIDGTAALFDPQACNRYADALTKRLDDRLAQERAAQ